METVIASGTGRRKARTERVRTTPPGLWLAGGGPASDETPMPAADLIALAQSARRTAADSKVEEPAERAQGYARSVPDG